MTPGAAARPADERGPQRLALVVAPVSVIGAATVVAALVTLSQTSLGWEALGGAAVLLLAATVAEAFPVPVEGVSAGGVSLAASFIVGTALVYGWQTATLVAFLCRLAIELHGRRPLVRVAYNSFVYAIAAAAGGGLVAVTGNGNTIGSLLGGVTSGSFGFYVVNVTLVALVVACASDQRFDLVFLTSVRWTAVPFAIMASVSLTLAALWERSPLLSGALLGPVIAVALYQRSSHGELEALRLAKTDPVTGLGNHRAFQEFLIDRIDAAADAQAPLTLVLADVDHFKEVNDRFGHQVGDAVLTRIADCLRVHGNSFRLGGDEFALVLDTTGDDAAAATRAVMTSVRTIEADGATGVSTSIGYASFPSDAPSADELFAAADSALYRAKNAGRDQSHRYMANVFDLASVRRRVSDAAQLRAARALSGAMEVADRLRDIPDSESEAASHSHRVSELAGRLASRLGLSAEMMVLIRLAGQVHDIGKLSVPVEILTKTGRLGDQEWRSLREHPETGRRMLDSLGVGAVADWVLHHHERWDGAGYPSGLAGEEIPLPSRIIFVADAFDAMTSERPYRKPMSLDAALAELIDCSGSQFDPVIVDALVAEFTEAPDATKATPATGATARVALA